ncbi:MAG: efflux RND transporter periplasmic adaptor subunit [Candidatus Omnitrophica bacterium]|nr:efflux RND transporter periplasmic adaptor subunit [Candidatus Omnitrophota bacterium]
MNVMPFIMAALVLAAGCGKKGQGGGWGDMVVQVVGFTAARQPIEETVSLVGTLYANEAVEIMSELDGTVDEIAFEEGQPVTKGQVLVLIDQQKLRASLAEVEARLQLADSTMQRYTALAESNAVSKQEIEKARAEYEAARASLALMHAQLEDATITAPFDGVVSSRQVSVGQLIMRGTRITSVVDPDPMKAEFHIPERYVGQVRPDQLVQLTVAAYPDVPFSGKVYFVDPRVDEATRTVLVKALVPNADGKLHTGMFANLKLVMQARKDALVIPEVALMVQGERTSVFVVGAEDKVEPRPVTTGVRLAGMVEVLDGVRAGETVIVEGLQKLGPGAKVSVRFEDPSAVALPGARVTP